MGQHRQSRLIEIQQARKADRERRGALVAFALFGVGVLLAMGALRVLEPAPEQAIDCTQPPHARLGPFAYERRERVCQALAAGAAVQADRQYAREHPRADP